MHLFGRMDVFLLAFCMYKMCVLYLYDFVSEGDCVFCFECIWCLLNFQDPNFFFVT